MNNKPFVSIVVCTLNGEKNIRDCLDALMKQDYPKNRYEVIVVDDGSTDGTINVVSKYNIKLVKHEKNLGIPTARNSGLAQAKGEIVAYTDDDCIPYRDWLTNLIEPYKNKDIMAVGGLTLPFSCNTYTEKFMFELGYGNPAPIAFGKSKNPVYRFIIYLKDMLKPVISNKKIMQVQDIYTLNASFKKSYLNHIHGFDKKLKTSEDTDICSRLHKAFKDEIIVFTDKAIILHRYRSSFIHYLKQVFMRSENTLDYYLKIKKIPPIFPFPIFIVICTLFTSCINPELGLITLITLPQICYFWWGVKFLKSFNIDYLLFPYMQLGRESSALLGMLRRYILILGSKAI